MGVKDCLRAADDASKLPLHGAALSTARAIRSNAGAGMGPARRHPAAHGAQSSPGVRFYGTRCVERRAGQGQLRRVISGSKAAFYAHALCSDCVAVELQLAC